MRALADASWGETGASGCVFFRWGLLSEGVVKVTARCGKIFVIVYRQSVHPFSLKFKKGVAMRAPQFCWLSVKTSFCPLILNYTAPDCVSTLGRLY